MDEAFEVVTDVAEISRLNKQLAEQLRAILPHKETREITYPAGHQPGAVYFEASTSRFKRTLAPMQIPSFLASCYASATN